MNFIADVLLISATLAAGFFCIILSKRLSRLNDLEKGVGGAVSVLSVQVDDLKKALIATQASAEHSNSSLVEITQRAEGVARSLELMMASMHDLPTKPQEPTDPIDQKQTRLFSRRTASESIGP